MVEFMEFAVPEKVQTLVLGDFGTKGSYLGGASGQGLVRTWGVVFYARTLIRLWGIFS